MSVHDLVDLEQGYFKLDLVRSGEDVVPMVGYILSRPDKIQFETSDKLEM